MAPNNEEQLPAGTQTPYPNVKGKAGSDRAPDLCAKSLIVLPACAYEDND
jgi:hypothetical protein